jgi:hypothetical protein
MDAERPAGRESRIEAVLRAERASGFAPGFAWRVMRRLHAETADPRAALAAAVQRHFARLAPLAALAAAVLITLNLRGAERGQTVLEAVLGLPKVTAEQAYAPDELLRATPAPEGKG